MPVCANAHAIAGFPAVADAKCSAEIAARKA
jgi:hypothetical protein